MRMEVVSVDHQASIIMPGGNRYDIHLAADEVAAVDATTARAMIGEAFAEAGL